MSKNNPKFNNEISASEIRLIGVSGEMIGVVPLTKALSMARDQGLDLVEISPNVSPPVCKIMDYGKFKYEMQKKAQVAKKKQKVVDIKEIKVRPTIAKGDYDVKLKKAIGFLEDGNKVRFSLVFKGREITHDEVGYAVITKFKEDLEEIGKVETAPKMEGKQIFMILSPK